jgi:hypothetical protein
MLYVSLQRSVITIGTTEKHVGISIVKLRNAHIAEAFSAAAQGCYCLALGLWGWALGP